MRTDVPDDLIADQKRRRSELGKVLGRVLDGIGALDVLRWGLEEPLGDLVRVRHVGMCAGYGGVLVVMVGGLVDDERSARPISSYTPPRH